MTFNTERRQRFLGEAHYHEHTQWLDSLIDSAKSHIAGEQGPLGEGAVGRFLWRWASESLDLLILHYTAGRPIAEISEKFPSLIDAFDAFIAVENPAPHEASALEITQLEAYVYVFWLLALAKLLGHDAQIPRIMAWVDKNERNRHRDGLFEFVVQKLTGESGPVERVLLHPDAYRPLAKAIVSTREERSAMVKSFLEGWYKQMRPCYWYGTHTEKEGSSYFGYWAFEAALVTYLWDIDDTSYRDNLYYPKDLVDFARSLVAQPNKPSGPDRVEAKQPCPREGYWYTLAKSDSRRFFKVGEMMPDFPDSTYGATIWNWDRNQDSRRSSY